MSVDTIQRVNAYFKANIEDVLPVYTIYENENEGLEESASGPMVKLWVEPDIDTVYTDGGTYQEDGIIIAQIYIEQGQSTLRLHSIADSIKTAFRQVQLPPNVPTTENSIIAFEDIDFANRGTIDREGANRGYGSNRPWRRWDVFITYSKYDCF